MSEKWVINKSTLDDIGNAIREKEGNTEEIPVTALANRIGALKIARGENKLPQLVSGNPVEITADDLEGVTAMKDYVFAKSTITSITIPDSVTSIGKYAFETNKNLTSVTMGNGVTSIGEYAFANCENLVEIILSNSLLSISPYMLRHCYVLSSLTIPDSVIEIDKYGFESCRALTSLTIPDSVLAIRQYAFFCCYMLESLTIPDSVTILEHNVINGCSQLKTLTIGSGIEKMIENAFNNSSALENFTIASPIPTSLSLKSSTKLTIDSLKNIINALVDYFGTENEGIYKLTLSSQSKTLLEAEGATAPNGLTWIDYINTKGWILV